MAKTKTTPIRCDRGGHRVELHSSDDPPGSRKPILRVYDCRQDDQPLVAEIELDDFCSAAQGLFELYLMDNLQQGRHTAYFKRRVKALRKALGYSYP
jgi:hypothetical protein